VNGVDVTAARHGGNAESEAAHESIAPDKARLRRMVLAYVRSRGLVGATSEEAEQALGIPHQTVSARITELKAAGDVYDTGRRRPTRSGRNAAVVVADDWFDGENEDAA
jgi:hypothetical protein